MVFSPVIAAEHDDYTDDDFEDDDYEDDDFEELSPTAAAALNGSCFEDKGEEEASTDRTSAETRLRARKAPDLFIDGSFTIDQGQMLFDDDHHHRREHPKKAQPPLRDSIDPQKYVVAPRGAPTRGADHWHEPKHGQQPPLLDTAQYEAMTAAESSVAVNLSISADALSQPPREEMDREADRWSQQIRDDQLASPLINIRVGQQQRVGRTERPPTENVHRELEPQSNRRHSNMRGVQRRTRLGEQLSQRGRSTTSFSRPTREGEFVESAGGSELLHPYHTQTVRQCHWKLGKKIGSGTFGTVHKVNPPPPQLPSVLQLGLPSIHSIVPYSL